MVANINKLNGRITENGYTKKSFAKEFGITEATLRKKIKEKDNDFTISESLKVKELLNLSNSDYLEIFFDNQLELES